jgi:hypothetical protein
MMISGGLARSPAPIGEALGPAKRQCATDRCTPFYRVFLLCAIMRAKRFHQQVPAVRLGAIDTLVREPGRCVTLNPDYSRGDDVKRHTSITQRPP